MVAFLFGVTGADAPAWAEAARGKGPSPADVTRTNQAAPGDEAPFRETLANGPGQLQLAQAVKQPERAHKVETTGGERMMKYDGAPGPDRGMVPSPSSAGKGKVELDAQGGKTAGQLKGERQPAMQGMVPSPGSEIKGKTVEQPAGGALPK